MLCKHAADVVGLCGAALEKELLRVGDHLLEFTCQGLLAFSAPPFRTQKLCTHNYLSLCRLAAPSPTPPSFSAPNQPTNTHTLSTQYALWGNKTDLSMLVDAAHMDAAALGLKTTTSSGSSGSGSGSGSNNIIADEFDALWRYLRVKARHEPVMGGTTSSDEGDYPGAYALRVRSKRV